MLFRFNLVAVLKGPFFTSGPGRVLPLVDRAVELDPSGRPLIPASTVKGRIRVHLERLARAFGRRICFPPRPDRMCPHADLGIESGYCLACRLFGSPWRESSVFFTDLRLSDERAGQWMRNYALPIRIGVGIDRRTQTVQAERMFISEFIPGSSTDGALRLAGEVSGSASEEELGWLLLAIRAVTHIGGEKSRGMGLVELKIEGLRVRKPGSDAWEPRQEAQLVEGVLNAQG